MAPSRENAMTATRTSGDATLAEPLAGRRSLPARLRKTLAHNWQLYVLVALPLVYLVIFHYVPMYGAQLAFKKYRAALGIWGSEWIGLDHFVAFFQSFQFQRVVRNTISISAYSLVAGFPVPIILAIALNNSQARRFKKTVQLVTYAPHFISTVVMCGMIIQFLSPSVGIVNKFIAAFGLQPIGFMGRPEWFQTIYVFSGIWQQAGYASIIFLAALASVSPELHEAAIVDGAGMLQRNWHIDLPAIMPTAIILLILNVGNLMSVGFEKVFLLQNAMNLETSEVIQTFVYKRGIAWQPPNFSYAAAVGLFNSVVNLVMLVAVNALARRVSDTSLW